MNVYYTTCEHCHSTVTFDQKLCYFQIYKTLEKKSKNVLANAQRFRIRVKPLIHCKRPTTQGSKVNITSFGQLRYMLIYSPTKVNRKFSKFGRHF